MTIRRTEANRRSILLFAALALLFSSGAARLGARTPAHDHAVVVELFTSQGCSSCPPADRLLARLASERPDEVIALSFHVDYWNSLGWRDPFSNPAWSRRQEAYARALGPGYLYTPQAVVDGSSQVVGSRERELREAIERAAAAPAASIRLSLDPKPRSVHVVADISVPAALRGRALDLMLALYETDLVTPVKRGENAGRELRDDEVVRRLVRAGRLRSSGRGVDHIEGEVPIAPGEKREHLGVAAFVQDRESLGIVGAAARALSNGEVP